MRRTLGTAVFAGMIGVTLFGLILTPVFYSVVRWFSERHDSNVPGTTAPQQAAEASLPAPTRRVVAIDRQDVRGTRLQKTRDALENGSDRLEE
jgi:hypothetical protein